MKSYPIIRTSRQRDSFWEKSVFCFLASFGFAFFIAELIGVDSLLNKFLVFLSFALCAALVILVMRYVNRPTLYIALLYAFTAAALLPLCVVASVEWSFFAAIREWERVAGFTGLFLISALTVIIFMCVGLWRYQFGKKDSVASLLRVLYPFSVFTTYAVIFYRPILNMSGDLFEPANPGVMIQQLIDFHRLPWIENFNAHGLSDAFLGMIYAAIYGVEMPNWQYFDWMPRTIELVLGYFLLARLLKSRDLAFIVLMLYPLIGMLLPANSTIALIVPLLMIRALEHGRWWRWYGVALICAFLIFWKIDVGAAVCVAMIGTLGYLLCLEYREIRRQIWSIVLGGTLAVAAVCGVIIGVSVLVGQDPLEWAQRVLHIMRSDQNFGYAVLWLQQTALVRIVLNLIVLPIITIGLLLALFFSDKVRSAFSLSERAVIWFLLIFSAYATTRGLVRHGLVENVTWAFFPFTLLVLWIVLCRVPRAIFLRWFMGVAGFIFISALLLVNVTTLMKRDIAFHQKYYFPPFAVIGWQFESSRAEYLRVWQSQGHVERSIVTQREERQYRDLLPVLNTLLRPDETFFDYSNAPMLYYLAHKPLPVFSNHHMLLFDEYLQQYTLDALEEQNVPVVVYRKVKQWFRLDYVHSHTKYPILDEYIQSHYSPLLTANGREVWIRNDWTPAKSFGDLQGKYRRITPLERTTSDDHYPLGAAAFLRGQYGAEVKDGSLKNVWSWNVEQGASEISEFEGSTETTVRLDPVIPIEQKQKNAQYLVLRLQLDEAVLRAAEPIQGVLYFYGHSNNENNTRQPLTTISFYVWRPDFVQTGNEFTYLLRVSPYPEWRNNDIAEIKFRSSAGVLFKSIAVQEE